MITSHIVIFKSIVTSLIGTNPGLQSIILYKVELYVPDFVRDSAFYMVLLFKVPGLKFHLVQNW